MRTDACHLPSLPLHALTPTFIANKGYSTTHFDMDAVEEVGLVKMDILAQGGLAAMRDVKALLAARGIEIDLEKCVARDKGSGAILRRDSQASEPWTDPNVWEMIASGHARSEAAGRQNRVSRTLPNGERNDAPLWNWRKMPSTFEPPQFTIGMHKMSVMW